MHSSTCRIQPALAARPTVGPTPPYTDAVDTDVQVDQLKLPTFGQLHKGQRAQHLTCPASVRGVSTSHSQ